MNAIKHAHCGPFLSNGLDLIHGLFSFLFFYWTLFCEIGPMCLICHKNDRFQKWLGNFILSDSTVENLVNNWLFFKIINFNDQRMQIVIYSADYWHHMVGDTQLTQCRLPKNSQIQLIVNFQIWLKCSGMLHFNKIFFFDSSAVFELIFLKPMFWHLEFIIMVVSLLNCSI